MLRRLRSRLLARVVKLVDTGDLKSPDHCDRAGSSPAPGTTRNTIYLGTWVFLVTESDRLPHGARTGRLNCGLNLVSSSVKLWEYLMLIKQLFVLTALCVSGFAVARSMPIFGVARFGEAQFGGVSVPVPFMPLWAIILLAVALWVVVYLMRTKES